MVVRITKVAVVIVTYRTAALTIEALTSVASERLHSPGLSIRAIVVDNASGDFPLIHQAIENNAWTDWVDLVDSPTNGGFGYGNNLGFKYASAIEDFDYYYLLNPDARCTTGAINALVAALEADPKSGIAGSSFLNEDGTLWPIAFRFPSLLGEVESGFKLGVISKLLAKYKIAVEMKQSLQRIDWVAGASMLIRKEVVRTLSGFDEQFFLYYEETEFCYRALLSGYHTLYVPTSVVTHIAGQSTKVTGRVVLRRRLPAYWYESRTLYYLKTRGVLYSLAADFVSIIAFSLGLLRLSITGKKHDIPLYYVLDILKNSCVFPRVYKKKQFKSSRW